MLRMPPSVRASIRAAAAAAWPAECCGALVGLSDEVGGAVVAHALPAANAAAEPERGFLMGPDTVRDLERSAQTLGAEVVGYYHSHPDGVGAVPSVTDRQWALPGLIYVIVGAAGPEFRAWRLREDRTGFDELRMTSPRQAPAHRPQAAP